MIKKNFSKPVAVFKNTTPPMSIRNRSIENPFDEQTDRVWAHTSRQLLQ